jgi:hypothetical protein
MMSIDGFDKGSQALQVHPRPAGQSIYRIDKSQPGANRIPGDYDRFHFAKSKILSRSIETSLISSVFIKLQARSSRFCERLFAIYHAGTLLITPVRHQDSLWK